MTIDGDGHPAGSFCCAPSRSAGVANAAPDLALRDAEAPRLLEWRTAGIPGGRGLVGTNAPLIEADGEGPLKTGRIRPVLIERTSVTNAAFAEFVAATGYRTEAERIGDSFVFEGLLDTIAPDAPRMPGAPWWRLVGGASWQHPLGPGSGISGLEDHPVVHVTWNDATAFADWAGGRLPTEAEWEHAARGGLGDVRYPWGDREPDDESHFPCNIWQGRFPERNAGLDGYIATAPAQSFEPNGYGLYNMVGNVWEWTSQPFRVRSLRKRAAAMEARTRGFKLLKGGSFLCHRSYCHRYRIAARSGASPDSSTSHQGFRLLYDPA